MKLSDLLSNAPKGLWGGELKNGESGTPVIKTNNMTYEGQINFTDLTYRSIDNRDAVPNYLQNGDLLVEKSGGTKTHSVGYINYFDGENQKYVANNFIFVLRPNEQLVSPKYLFYQMKYKYESGQIRNCYEQTTGIQNLRVKSYLQKEVLCPSRTIQNDVVLSLDSIASAISIEKASLLLADELIKSRFNEQFINNPSFTTKKWYEVLNIINGRDYKGHEGTKYPIYGSGGFMGIYANNFLASGILTIIGRKGTIDRPLLVNGEIWNIGLYG